MAFQLGSFIVQLLGDTSHLDGALQRVQGLAQSVGRAVSGVGSGGMTIPGADATKKTLEGAAHAGFKLKDALQSLLEIDLSTILQLGTITGVVGLLGSATKRFMDLSDEAKNTEFRFRMLRMETEENTKRFFDFGKQMQESFGIAAAESRKLQMEALTKGINPGRYQQMTAAAVGLAAATGKSTAQAMNVITQLEAGNTRVLRGMHTSFRIAMEQGASRFTLEQMVNDMIRKGADIQKERMNTFTGQIQRLQNNFSSLRTAIAEAIGPAFAPIVSKVADAIATATEKLTAYVAANKETIGHTIRLAAGIAAGAAAALLFRNHLTSLLGVFGHLIPSLGGLWSAFGAGYGVAPFAAIRAGVWGLLGAIRGVAGFALQAGFQIAFSLINPVRWATGIYQATMLVWQGITASTGVVAGVAAAGVRLFGLALRGVLMATGVGLLIGLVGMLAGVADTFGDASTGVEGFGSVFRDVIAQVKQLAQPVIEWLRVEGMIVFKALVAAAHQMVDNLKLLWQNLKDAWKEAVTFLRENFGGAIKWLEDTYNIKIDSIKSMWEEFTAEVAVLGLRIRQVFLLIGIGLATIPHLIQWVGQVFRAFGEFVQDKWALFIVNAVKLVWESLKLLGNGLEEIGSKIGDALDGKNVEFDFSKTEAAWERVKEQAQTTMAGFKMPALDTSNVAPGLKAELDKVTGEIDRKKQQARESQAKDRLNAQNRSTGKTDDSKSGAPTGNTLIGGRDKAHFQETVGFWKKVQEAGANQRAEYLQQQQLDQQRMMVELLTKIHNAGMPVRPGGPPPVIPRGT